MLHGCIDDEGARRMADGEEEDMDRRRGILCTFFSGGWASALSLFCAKAKQSFSAWYKKAGRERNRKGVGEGKKNRLLGSRLPRGPGLADRIGAVFFCTRMGEAGPFCVLYHGKGNKKRLLLGMDAEGEGKVGWAMQIGINAMHS
jgi:hypothetical protein